MTQWEPCCDEEKVVSKFCPKALYKCKAVFVMVCAVWSRGKSPGFDFNKSGFKSRLFYLKAMTWDQSLRFSEPEFPPKTEINVIHLHWGNESQSSIVPKKYVRIK